MSKELKILSIIKDKLKEVESKIPDLSTAYYVPHETSMLLGKQEILLEILSEIEEINND